MMDEKKDFKSGFVALIGRPNVGKSTLLNYLVGQKVAIMSPQPQTTRNKISGIYTDDQEQIVFIDTPGIHKPKNKLDDFMDKSSYSALDEVDVVLFMVEPEPAGKGDQYIAELLKKIKKPVFLVINKIDTVQKELILTYIDAYRKHLDFAEIVPVSALKKDGMEVLLKCIMKYLPYGEPFYDEDTVTDQPMRQIVAELIREKALRCLEDEIPHGIAVTIELMKFRKHIVDIEATIVWERESHKGIISGKQGSMLKKIGSLARPDIEEMVERQVNLKLWVKVKKDWRDSDYLLKNFGYNPKETE